MAQIQTKVVRSGTTGKVIGTVRPIAGVGANVIKPNTRPAMPGPVMNLQQNGGELDSLTVTLTGAAVFKVGDGDNIYELVSGRTLADPTSTGVSGITGAILNASFSDSPVEVAEMNVEASTSAAAFSTLPQVVKGERNGYSEAVPLPIAGARSSADYNPKIRIFSFQPGQLVFSRNRALVWDVAAGESLNCVFKVRDYRE